MTSRFRSLSTCAIVGLLLVSCAQRAPQVQRPESDELQRRYLAALAQRESALSGVDADLHLWLTHHGKREPGVEAALLIGGRERMRLRIAAIFGTALDAAIDGDSLRIYMPRAGVWDADARQAPVQFSDAGERLVRAWAATWRPPAAAWRTGTWNDSLYRMEWSRQNEAIELSVGPSGLPREVILRTGEHALQLAYEHWRVQDGLAWPVRLVCRDLAQSFELKARLRIMWFRDIPEDRLRPGVPEDARSLDWEQVRELLNLEDGQ